MQYNIIRLLLSNEADPYACNNEGKTPAQLLPPPDTSDIVSAVGKVTKVSENLKRLKLSRAFFFVWISKQKLKILKSKKLRQESSIFLQIKKIYAVQIF